MFVYGKHLSGVITFLRTTKALSRRGKGGNSSFLSSKWFFLGGKTVDTTRQIIDTEKKKLIQFIAVTSLTAVKIEERNEKSNSIRWQENLVSSVFFGVLYAVVARLIVDALRPWKSGNKRYLSPSMIFRNRDFLLTCVTKFSSVSIWTNTGEAIYPILTGTTVFASNTDTIIDVWKQPHTKL